MHRVPAKAMRSQQYDMVRLSEDAVVTRRMKQTKENRLDTLTVQRRGTDGLEATFPTCGVAEPASVTD
jgi:hypothetical protein